jgi:DNA-binding NarL/FixJ family response regulator
MNRPRLLLAEDHPETRALLRTLLQPEFDVLTEVADGLALVSAAERLSPDVIVTDISMPGLDGIAAATRILGRDPAARIVFVTAHGEAVLAERGVAAGALGFVLKVAAEYELVPAVQAAMRGECHISADCRPNHQRSSYDGY